MAVTQQLARLDSGTLEECRRSVDALDAVCRYQRLGSDDYLDLDWAPAMLVATAEAAGLDASLRSGLQLAMSGEGEVNPAYRDRADSVWEHPVSSLTPDRVREVAHALDTLARTKFLSERAVEDGLVLIGWPDRPDRPTAYLQDHFEALREFYEDAYQRSLCTLMWWD